MKHILAVILKFIIVAVILEIALIILTNLGFRDILIISAIVTIVSYIIGDVLILRGSSNAVATFADMILAFSALYLFNYWYGSGTISVSDAVISAIAIGVGEWFFHKFMAKVVYPEPEKQT